MLNFNKAYAATSLPGDVVINELMWMGSTLSPADEWIELKNNTNSIIDISNWTITKAATNDADLTIPAGKSIPANGYFLISNYDKTNISSKLDVTSDLVTTDVSLANTSLQLVLKNELSTEIDKAGDGTVTPFAGDNTNKYSMERNAIYSDGSIATNWHTATTTVGFDAVATEKGTPGSINSSDYDHTLPTSIISAINSYYKTSNFPSSISGTASDDNTGVGQVGLRIQKTVSSTTYYWSESANDWTTIETWNATVGTNSWSFDTTNLLAKLTDGVSYTVNSCAIDSSSNLNRETNITDAASQKIFVYDTTPPIVNAGLNKNINSIFSQDATVTGATSYAWTTTSGPGAITFGSATSEDTTISASVDGTYVIKLTATDDATNSAYDEFTLVWDTTPPIVNAGTNKTKNAIYTQDATVTGATSYQWSKTSGPGEITFGSATSEDTTISASVDGTYKIRLTATDDLNNSNYNEFTLIWDKTIPTVSAGTNKTKNAVFTQTGTATDSTSGIASYAWTKVSGPGEITFGSSNAISTTISASVEGTYTLALSVTDNAGNISSNTMTLVWDLTKPVVNAGLDQLKNAIFTQTGSATDTNGIASFAWSKVSGTGAVAFGTINSSSTTISADTNGAYVIRLTATDNAGNVNSDDFDLTWDATLPTGSITINNGNAYTNSLTVTLDLNTTDVSGIKSMAFSNNGVDFTTFEDYTSIKSYTLATGDGVKTVYFKFIDKAGNIGNIVSDSIILDTTIPTDPTVTTSPNEQTLVKGDSINLSGTTEPNNLVTIRIYSDAKFTEYVYADNNGDWSYTITDSTLNQLEAGNHKITITTTDLAGNVSNEKEISSFLLKDKKVASFQPTTVAYTRTAPAIVNVSKTDDSTITTVAPEDGQTKGDETDNSTKTRTLVTLAIIILAIGAIAGGYYGYEWWMDKDKKVEKKDKPQVVVSKEKPKQDKKSEKFGRW